MTTERIEELREKYKSVQLGSWPAVEKFVSGAYQDVKELLDEVERVKAERDAAVDCIGGIEEALNFQRTSAIGLRISKWCGLQGGEVE